MRGRKRKQGMLAQLPRKPQGTWPEWRPAVHIGQTPGLPGIGLGSVPGCEMATLHGAFFQEPDDKDPSQQARFGHAPAEGYVRPGRQGGDTEKVADVEQKLCDMGLKSAADLYRKGVMETLTYLDFPHEHWRSIRTNNILERLNREIRRRTRVVGCLQKHPRLGYENMQACFRITRLVAFSRTGNLP